MYIFFTNYSYTSHSRRMRNVFYGTGGSATIKHRCVTHLYGSKAIEQGGYNILYYTSTA